MEHTLWGFIEAIVGHFFAKVIIDYGPLIVTVIISMWMRSNKKHFWLLPLIIGFVLATLVFVANRLLPIPLPVELFSGSGNVTIGPMNTSVTSSWPVIVWVILVSTFWVASIILTLFFFKNKDTGNKIVLPYKHVSIGKFVTSDNSIAVDIQAMIVLNDKMQPDEQNFLNRIALGEPHCPVCGRPLDKLRASWMADGVQIGYECTACNIQRQYTWEDLRNDVFAKVRYDYYNYWKVYKELIQKITCGKPKDYILPS
jgi:Zn ribbon nucleic-acid-binding protein